jgi:protein gp37
VSEHSTISWTDATWPIVAGCDYESPGCSNCWAVRDSWRMAHNPNPKIHNAYFGTVDKRADGKLVWSGVVRELHARLDWPLKWRKPKRIFVCSQSDLFHPKVSFDFIAAAFGVMAAASWHTFQVLTKHPVRAREFFKWLDAQKGHPPLETCLWKAHQYVGGAFDSHAPFHDKLPAWPLENVWFGVTVEDQKRADLRIPHLLRIPAAVRWLSVEPMLEAIDLGLMGTLPRDEFPGYQMVWMHLHLVVCGGESAQTRAITRPFDIAWGRDLLDQCRGAKVRFHMKQLGTVPVEGIVDIHPRPAGTSSRYKWHEPQFWPEDLRVQEFPA